VLLPGQAMHRLQLCGGSKVRAGRSGCPSSADGGLAVGGEDSGGAAGAWYPQPVPIPRLPQGQWLRAPLSTPCTGHVLPSRSPCALALMCAPSALVGCAAVLPGCAPRVSRGGSCCVSQLLRPRGFPMVTWRRRQGGQPGPGAREHSGPPPLDPDPCPEQRRLWPSKGEAMQGRTGASSLEILLLLVTSLLLDSMQLLETMLLLERRVVWE